MSHLEGDDNNEEKPMVRNQFVTSVRRMYAALVRHQGLRRPTIQPDCLLSSRLTQSA
jgi:hypothetical protein